MMTVTGETARQWRTGFRSAAARVRLAAALVFMALACTGCQGLVQPLKQPLQNEGSLHLYLEPFPQEANRLDLSLAAVAAVKEDGTTSPLTLHLSRLTPDSAGRQRLLASGELQPGTYRGLSFAAAKATIRTEEGTAELLKPEQDTVIDFPFTVRATEALMATLKLVYRDTVQDGFRVVPAFTAAIPTRPLPALTGYISITGAHAVTVFDKKSGEATGIIATGRDPKGMALDRKQQRLYVALSGDDAIEVIDTSTDTAISRIPLTMGDTPKHLSLTPDGKTLLVVNNGSNTVSIVDPFSLTETARIDVGNSPESAVIDPLGQKAYVLNRLSATISIIDMASLSVSSTTTTEAEPFRAQMNRLGDRLTVMYGASPNLVVYEPSTMRVVRRLSIGMGAATMKQDPLTDLLYVSMKNDPVISVFNPYSLLSSDRILVDDGPDYLAIDGELGNLLCLVPSRRSLTITSLVGKAKSAEIDLDDEPYWLVVNGER